MRNSRTTARDMLISLAVIMVPVVLIYWWFARVPDAPEVPAADWKPVVADARSQAPYQVLAPANLPPDWKPIRARYGDGQLQLGFLSPEQVYFEVKQMVGSSNPEFVRDVTRKAHPDGTSEVNGRSWNRMVTDDGRTRCLVNTVATAKPATTVVCADVDYTGVEAFAGTLA